MTTNSKTKTAGNPNWRKGMNSPNPQGRPKGIIDKRMKVNQSLLADADDIAKVVIQSALSGDMQAASLVLSRIAPTLKAQTETVQFELDPQQVLPNKPNLFCRLLQTAMLRLMWVNKSLKRLML